MLPRRVGVHGKLDLGARIQLLEAGRRKLEESRASYLRVDRGHPERDPEQLSARAQRRALFKRRKNPSSSSSSGLYVSGPAWRPNSSRS